MRTRACPACEAEFKRSKIIDKIRTCPGCGVQLYYKVNNTILYADKVSAAKVVSEVEGHISRRDHINFRFEGSLYVKELSLAYSLIDRAKAFLGRQIDVGLSPCEFCLEIVSEVLSDQFWGRVTKSIAMFMGHISDFASKVFVRHKNEVEQRSRDANLLDFMSVGSET